ncbi:MFS transporter [Methylobacterium sp. R2-1]|uniref:CynX/NimT family MFS transporter n=1 Tax=Methylobacterium sp. R2-1 TaxID=2587064 RepID=UPI0016126919|nr:MFS transporter [Methylobacterium sp. R2-1]MBB2963367.1 CP family cyanate transporter-like MFS transporter [Methylobacterium sp. R2-1]
MPTRNRPPGPALSILPFLLLAANLRPALTSVGPLIEPIRQTTGLSLTAAGLLNSLPLLALAAFAPLAHFGRRFGAERTLVAALLLLAAGILIRSSGSTMALFAGSACLAGGIAIGNVLVPGIIKRDYPDRVKGLTTLYAVTLGLTAAVASALAVPLATWLPGGWQTALAIWAVPAFVAALAWSPIALRTGGDAHRHCASKRMPVWRSGVAWLVTGFMGLQSLYFYVAVAWLPTIFQHDGYAPAEAGLLITLFQLVALAVSAMMPLILGRAKDQSRVACVAALLVAVAMGGVLLFPAGAYLWMIVAGLGGGACLPLALAFISLRAADHHQAASLSMMSQSVGYLLAAFGPFTFGLLHDLTGTWSLPLAVLVAFGLLFAAVGYGAGRDRTLA